MRLQLLNKTIKIKIFGVIWANEKLPQKPSSVESRFVTKRLTNIVDFLKQKIIDYRI